MPSSLIAAFSAARPKVLAWLPVATLLALAGCSPAILVNALVPGDSYVRTSGLPYGPDPRQVLDVYRPQPDRANAPVIVFFYGGSWQDGSRASYLFVGEALAAQGFVVIIPDYRVYPQVVFPGFVEDGARAVRWSFDHAAEYGGDLHHVFLAGHSAGAHIAMLLGLDRHYLADAGVDASRLAGLIGMAGPYDFLPLTDPALKRVFGPADSLARTQPINFVDAGEPPVLLQYGEDDDTVAPTNSRNLAAKLARLGDRVELIGYPGYGHLGLIARIATPLKGDSQVLPDLVRFVRAHSTR
jgi:acetyl esterase/lipase